MKYICVVLYVCGNTYTLCEMSEHVECLCLRMQTQNICFCQPQILVVWWLRAQTLETGCWRLNDSFVMTKCMILDKLNLWLL